MAFPFGWKLRRIKIQHACSVLIYARFVDCLTLCDNVGCCAVASIFFLFHQLSSHQVMHTIDKKPFKFAHTHCESGQQKRTISATLCRDRFECPFGPCINVQMKDEQKTSSFFRTFLYCELHKSTHNKRVQDNCIRSELNK